MKRFYKKIAISALVVATIFTTGCSSDFMNDPKPTDQLSPDVIFGSRDGADAYMSGIIRRMRGQFTTGHDAGGLNSMLFARAAKGNDIIIGTSWFNFDYEQDNREPTYRRTTFSWEFSYYVIGQLNQFISGVQNSALSDNDKGQLLGQARALRGYFYHQLVLEFNPSYSSDPSFPAPPIYTEEDAGTTEGKPMSTAQQVYDFIVDDLTYAVGVLNNSRLDKSYINLQVANAMLAQVYQVMGNWQGAEAAANAAYGGNIASVLKADDYKNGFGDFNSVEWIWGLAQYGDQSSYYYSAPFSQFDHRVLSYSNAYVNSEFVSLFSGTDVRRIFANFYNVDDQSYRFWITDKFSFEFDADYPVIRAAEMILVEAEAKYHNSDMSGAHDLLYALQLNRDPSAVRSSNTGQDLLEEIYLERRKELYGENGVEWFDAKRLQRGITRTGNHRVDVSLDPNDKRFFLKIPQPEIDANEHIDDSVNANR